MGQSIVPAHELTITVRVPEWVPGHVERGHDLPDFQKNRQRLIADGHYHCFRCTLAGRTPVNPVLQCHHLSEWAEWGDADPAKVLELARWIDPYGYAAADPTTPITNPNDVRLLMFLCAECHIGAPKDPAMVTTEPTDYISGGLHYCTWIDWLADAARVRDATKGIVS